MKPVCQEWDTIRNDIQVKRALQGALRWKRHEVARVSPLESSHLEKAEVQARESRQYDDLLFAAMLESGFFGLHRLGELVKWRDPAKIIKRYTVKISPTTVAYKLAASKTDPYFEGSLISIRKDYSAVVHPYSALRDYIQSRDKRFKFSPFLFLKNDGSVPKRGWFLKRLLQISRSSRSFHEGRWSNALCRNGSFVRAYQAPRSMAV